jgi:hypothetical protein
LTLINTDLECPAAALLLQLFAFLNPDMILPDFLEAGSEALHGDLRNVIADSFELELDWFFVDKTNPRAARSIDASTSPGYQPERDGSDWHAWSEKLVCFVDAHSQPRKHGRFAAKFQEQVSRHFIEPPNSILRLSL